MATPELTPETVAHALRISIPEATQEIRRNAPLARAKVRAAQRGITVHEAAKQLHAEAIEVETAVAYISQAKETLAAASPVRPARMEVPAPTAPTMMDRARLMAAKIREARVREGWGKHRGAKGAAK